MSSLSMFISWFKEYYKHEFTQLTDKFKNEWIEEILMNNGNYITKKMVFEFDGCVKCGKCCIDQRCPHVNKETKLCERHDNPIDQLCIDYPWTGELGISPLTLNCRYQVSFFISYFNGFFAGCIRRGVEVEQ